MRVTYRASRSNSPALQPWNSPQKQEAKQATFISQVDFKCLRAACATRVPARVPLPQLPARSLGLLRVTPPEDYQMGRY